MQSLDIALGPLRKTTARSHNLSVPGPAASALQSAVKSNWDHVIADHAATTSALHANHRPGTIKGHPHGFGVVSLHDQFTRSRLIGDFIRWVHPGTWDPMYD